jgi:hypothetical protein
MDTQPAWTSCLHVSAGTCPHLMMQGQAFWGGDSPRPELTQDLALEKLGLACQTCPLAPEKGSPQ